ncbi:hemolysin family protein [Chloroflexi bacterium TSY]|nr:hemolysin family protein [Chloroflexi bacterium TSY]
MITLIIAALVVIIASGVCSGTEAALFSISTVKVRQLAQSNSPAAQALLAIQEDMTRPIATIVVLTNISNIVGSIAVGNLASSVLGSQWLGLFSGILTFLIIIFSEIIPKTLGERHADRVALLTARPVNTLTWLLSPVVWLLEKVTSPFTYGESPLTTNESEIRLLAQIGRHEGVIESDESEMIERVFHLKDVTAADIMTPRVNMTYLDGQKTLTEVLNDVQDSQHTRIVIIDDNRDNVTGLVLKAEILQGLVDGQADRPVKELQRDVHFVPETAQADMLLTDFQRSKQHLYIVQDEFGGVSGVVTLEDVLEVLIGEIVDETDKDVDLRTRIE